MPTPSRFRPAALALACTAALLAAGCGGDKPEALIASAKTYLAKNDRQAAIIQLKNALQKNPDNAEARFLLGRTELEIEDPASAENELRRALALKYPAAEVTPLLGRALLAQGAYKKVVDEIGPVTAATPEGTAELKTMVGGAQLMLNNTDASRVAFAAARNAKADYAPAILGDARLRARGGDFAGALAGTEDTIRIAPKSAEAWQLKGDVLLAQGQSDAAVAAYRKAIEIQPNYYGAHASLAGLLAQQGQLDDAAKSLETMKKLAPKHPQTYYVEALLRYRQRNLEAARAAIQQQLKYLPDNLPGTLLSGAIDYDLKAYSQAETSLLRVLQQAPSYDAARRLLVGTYLQSGQPGKALETLKPMLPRIEKDAQMLAMAGEIYLQTGEPTVAAGYFQRAAALDPSSDRPRTGLALSHLAQGDATRGMKELEEAASGEGGARANLALIATSLQRRDYDKTLSAVDALEKKEPNKPTPHNLRGIALLAKGDVAGARKSFERAVAIDPDFFPAVANLARLDLAAKKPEDAKKRFEALVARNPKNGQALLALAELAAQQNPKSEEPAALINKAIAAQPADSAMRIALVNYYLRINDTKRALSAAQDALAALPGRPEIVESLGRAQQQSGDYNQALATFNRLVELQPGSPIPYVHIAEVQGAQKNYDAAAQALQKALSIKPDLLGAQRGLVAAYLGANQIDKALALSREIQKNRAKEPIGYLLEGDVHASKGQWQSALAAYRNGLRQAPNTELAIKVYASHLSLAQFAEADRMVASWLGEHPDDERFKLYVADSAGGPRRDYAMAVKYYGQLLEKHPDNPVLLNNFAWNAGRAKDPRALEYAEKAYKLAPNEPQVLDTYASLLADTGDAARAVEILAKAVAAAPNAANIRLDYARALIKAGRKDAAKKELDVLAKLGPAFAGQDEVAQLAKTL